MLYIFEMGNVIPCTSHPLGTKTVKILVVGLGNAGKSTIIRYLKYGHKNNSMKVSTSAVVETVTQNKIRLTLWEIRWSGKELTMVWPGLFQLEKMAGVIFVIDSSDRPNVAQVRVELSKLLDHQKLSDAIFLIFANKQDIPAAMQGSELIGELNLESYREHKWHIQTSCAISGSGLQEGIEWLADQLS